MKYLVYLGSNIPTETISRLLQESKGNFTFAGEGVDPADFDEVVHIGDFDFAVPDNGYSLPATTGRFSQTTLAKVVQGLAIDRELPDDWELLVPDETLGGFQGQIWEIWHENKMKWVVARGVLPEDIPPPIEKKGEIIQHIPLNAGWVVIPDWVSRS